VLAICAKHSIVRLGKLLACCIGARTSCTLELARVGSELVQEEGGLDLAAGTVGDLNSREERVLAVNEHLIRSGDLGLQMHQCVWLLVL
jgi:hypothetical protein